MTVKELIAKLQVVDPDAPVSVQAYKYQTSLGASESATARLVIGTLYDSRDLVQAARYPYPNGQAYTNDLDQVIVMRRYLIKQGDDAVAI